MPDWRVPLSRIDYGPEEEAAVLRVLRSQWLTMGDEVARFEQAFARAVNVPHAIGVVNASAALHLALLAIGVEPGDEVIQPSLNFVAAANMTRLIGAEPVFVDIVGLEEPTIDPTDICRCITPKTKAVVVMHYGGYMCRMDEIHEVCREYDLPIVEDACHAPLARYASGSSTELDGRPAGDLGDVATFSFFGNKNLVTGEGGMIVTRSDAIAQSVRLRRCHGMTTVTVDRFLGRAFAYDIACTGFNYRPTEMVAALGQVQLEKLPELTERRREATSIYRKRLAETVPTVTVPFADHRSEPACHVLTVVLPTDCDRKAVMRSMRESGVQTSIHYRAVHTMTNFGSTSREDLRRSEQYSNRVLTLPLFPSITASDIDLVCSALAKALKAQMG